MDVNGYVTFLILGVVLVLADGRLISRSGRRYLQGVYEPNAGRSIMQLVAALFHFVMLGLLALISLVDVDTGLPVRDVVVKLGVLLLVLAVAHALAITILMRIRARRRQEQLSEEITESRYGTGVQGATVHPVSDTENGGRQAPSTEMRW